MVVDFVCFVLIIGPADGSDVEPLGGFVLVGAVDAYVVVAEAVEAGAEAGNGDVRGVAIRAEMAEHDAAEGGVGDLADEFGDLGVG